MMPGDLLYTAGKTEFPATRDPMGPTGMEIDLSINSASMNQPADERLLIERARRDRAAFATLYRLHHSAIARYLHRRIGDNHIAEDLASDVFLAALKGMPRFTYRNIPIRAWLYRIATNSANRWAKRHQRAAIRQWKAALENFRHSGGGVFDPGKPPQTTTQDFPGGAIERESAPSGESTLTGDAARQAMLTLSPRHQAVLTLHYLEGLSIVDVAAALGCSEGTVKSRLFRGREALRKRLEPWRTSS